MIPSFLSRGIIMLVGYVYPAYECFKAVEKNRPDVQQLRFWCQYWMIIAIITVVERVGDVLISWVPMYNEAKLIFIVYLWYPETKGTSYIYATFLKPSISSHETEIDKRLSKFRVMVGDMVYSYWELSSVFVRSKALELLKYVTSQSSTPDHTQKSSQSIPSQYQQPSAPTARSKPPVSPGYFAPLSSYYPQPSPAVPGNADVPFSSPQPSTGAVHAENPASQTAFPKPSFSPTAPVYPALGSSPPHHPYSEARYTASTATSDHTSVAPSGFYPPLSGSYLKDLVEEDEIAHISANDQTEQRSAYPTILQAESEPFAAGYMTRSRRRTTTQVHP